MEDVTGMVEKGQKEAQALREELDKLRAEMQQKREEASSGSGDKKSKEEAAAADVPELKDPELPAPSQKV